jgi:hypothetical protein
METAVNPTAWFVCHDDEGAIIAVARWYSPGSTKVEVFNRMFPEWTERDMWLTVQEDPDWEWSDQATVDDWVASLGSAV